MLAQEIIKSIHNKYVPSQRDKFPFDMLKGPMESPLTSVFQWVPTGIIRLLLNNNYSNNHLFRFGSFPRLQSYIHIYQLL